MTHKVKTIKKITRYTTSEPKIINSSLSCDLFEVNKVRRNLQKGHSNSWLMAKKEKKTNRHTLVHKAQHRK